jgi:hypothetical protein
MMIEKIDTSRIQSSIDKSLSKQPGSADNVTNQNIDASLQVDYASLIDKAVNAQQSDVEPVRRAKELLLSGKLDSPENIRAAAENIITFGI